MNRHIQESSLNKNIKRGFSIILAFILCIGVNIQSVKAYVPQGSLQITYVNFYSLREVNESTGQDLINNEDWIVIDFNFDGYFSGTVDITWAFSKPQLAYPEHTCIGANAYRLSSNTSGSTSYVTQTDRWLFKFENTQHFQFMYHLASTGGMNFSGQFGNITVDVTHSEDGTVVPGVSVDYTNLLTDILGYTENIYTDIDTIGQDIALIKSYSSEIASTIEDVLLAIQDADTWNRFIDIVNLIPWYSRDAYSFLYRIGYRRSQTNNILTETYGYNMVKPSSLSTSTNLLYLSKDVPYILVVMSMTASSTNWEFKNVTANENFSVSSIRNKITGANTLKTFEINNSRTSFIRISSIQNDDNLVPIYFGTVDSMPNEVAVILNKASNNTLLGRLVDLFTQNNQQNDDVLQSLQGINQNQQTISQNITTFNNDFNTALQQVPLGDVTQQLQNMQSTFQMQNDIWSQLWDALGKVRLVFILLLIILLMKMFVGRDK